MSHLVDRPEIGESNGLVDGNKYHKAFQNAKTVCWSTKGLRITRVRLLSDPGFPFWDVSYCHGELNGEPVEVRLPFDQIPKRGFQRFIVKQGIQHGVYTKGLGLLNDFIYSKLC